MGLPCQGWCWCWFLTAPCCRQYLMEGAYNKVFLARESVPAQSYTRFLNILVDAIRCVVLFSKAPCSCALALSAPPTPLAPASVACVCVFRCAGTATAINGRSLA
jgi:hypothetical protein